MVAYINWSAVTTPLQLIAIPAQVTPWFWTMMMFALFTIIVISLIGNGIEIAVLIASMISFIASVFLLIMGGMSWMWTLSFLCILFIDIGYIYWSSTRNNT
jgi:sterol desaturase/sphingolipid hydroxylase (fatty acid hydroxylase superfamily)